MQCSRIRRMLANYALEDARVTERLCVEVHTSHCPSCRKELEDVCELIAACERALSHPFALDDFDALMARIDAGEMPAREIPLGARWNWRALVTRAAAVAAVIAVFALTAPVARNAGNVMRELQEISSDRDLPRGGAVQVPVVSGPFVKRMLEIKNGYESVRPARATGPIEPLLP